MTSKRRKRRHKGKRKELRKEALKTWAKLTYVPAPEAEWGGPSVIIPMIRNVMPDLIAQDIVGVQPMAGLAAENFKMKVRYERDSTTSTSTKNS